MHRMCGAVKLLLCTILSNHRNTSSLSAWTNSCLSAYTLLFVSILSRSLLHAISVFGLFDEVINILVLKSQ